VDAIQWETWHHVVGVRDTADNKLYLYLDGDYTDDADCSIITGNMKAVPGTLWLGRGYNAYPGTYRFYYYGLLDEVAVYGRALTADEVRQHYKMGRP